MVAACTFLHSRAAFVQRISEHLRSFLRYFIQMRRRARKVSSHYSPGSDLLFVAPVSCRPVEHYKGWETNTRIAPPLAINLTVNSVLKRKTGDWALFDLQQDSPSPSSNGRTCSASHNMVTYDRPDQTSLCESPDDGTLAQCVRSRPIPHEST